MQTVVILISVDDFSNGRKIAENIENTLFNTPDDILRKVREKEDGFVAIYPITDFMDACNNQEIELEGVWVSYAQVVKMQNSPTFS
jgi:hypothetical protein